MFVIFSHVFVLDLEFENLPFVEFLTKHDLQANLRQYIIHCIAMVEETTPTIKVSHRISLMDG